MHSKSILLSLAVGLLGSSLATAGSMCAVGPKQGVSPVISLQGGVSGLNISSNNSQVFTGTDGEKFIYVNEKNTQTSGLIGAFLGAEFPFSYQNFFFCKPELNTIIL